MIFCLRSVIRAGLLVAALFPLLPSVAPAGFDDCHLTAASYLGGAYQEEGWPSTPTALDAEGNIVMAIGANSSGLEVPAGGYDPGFNGIKDVYIVKIDPDLSQIIAATYLGGSGSESAEAIAIDGSGRIFVIGSTYSANFPTTEGAYDRTRGSSNDVFVACLSADLGTLIASTYIGGNGNDHRGDIVISDDVSVFAVFETSSTDMYTSPSAIRGSYCGGPLDIYIIRMDAGLTGAAAATYLGGNNFDCQPGLAVDDEGNLYCKGSTFSTNFPTTPGAFDPYNNDNGMDAFLCHLGMNLDTIIASTYIGGVGDDWIYSLKREANGDLYITGHVGAQWPTTPGCFDSTYGGGPDTGDDAYLSCFSADLTTVKASTFLGGNGWDWGVDVKIDNDGFIYVTGETWSPDFPYTDGAYDFSCCDSTDIFLSVFDSSMQTLHMSTFIGGDEADRWPSVLPTNDNGFYVIGYTESGNMETTPGCYDPSYNSGGDIYLASFSLDPFFRVDNIEPVSESECSFGAAWADYDGDQYPDLFVTCWWPSGYNLNALYQNNGDGSFTSRTDLIPGQEGNTLGAVWADYNNDGNTDLFVARPGTGSEGALNYLYQNSGDGSFAKITTGPIATQSAPSTHPLFSDFDSDGDLDLLVGNHNYAPGLSYFRNDDSQFVQLDNGAIGLDTDDCGAVVSGDADGDGYPEFIHARNMLTGRYYNNNGDGTFSHVSNAISEDSTRAFAWGDYDNDGDLDLCGGSTWSRGLILYNNDGAGGFSRLFVDSGDVRTTVMRKPHWVDYDNDGDLDLFVCTQGAAYAAEANCLYINDGGEFSPMTGSILVTDSAPSSGAAWADYDRDGDLDLFLANTNFSHDDLYRNETGNKNKWISIKCVGIRGNRSGIGAVVRVKADIGGSIVRQMREISSQTGFMGQSEMRAHFGLGDAVIIDSLIVEWPGGPIITRMSDVAINQHLTIVEPICGDSNTDGEVNVGDAVFLINYVFKGGDAPDPIEAGDANFDSQTNVGDAVYLIAYIFKGGAEPCQA